MENENVSERLLRARQRFGRMLVNWRKRQGWSGQTWEDWAIACPDVLPVKLLNSVVTGLELGRNEKTAPITFVALGLANQLLAKEDRGTIRDRVLRDRVYQAQPIRHEDGEPWDGADFFAAFTGFIDPPVELVSEDRPMDEAAAVDLTVAMRERFNALAKADALARGYAMKYLLSRQPRIAKPVQAVIKDALLGVSDFAPNDVDAIQTAEILLQRWESEAQVVDIRERERQTRRA